ncbi:hypothetical protein [Polynucleobacter sp. UK-Mo-2m-Kol15]|jgi:hypothetical protein|uniref:hypothetical protein n=1 Tax=Polynucleobacter sp. UK-Mo-2m-Kol15 TaxID=2576916 RepID=UPI001C0AD1A7|nr:hypothetical protein [Polynucleobacter sp. UK-Mo-2m-Kol15]MBU3576241.1 hypothetical protein [Polynucleobacter sp. UK-Mo-2m-Kol15]
MATAPKNTTIPGRTTKDWSTKGIQGYVMLMVEFLRISPSYALAHEIRTKKIAPSKQAPLILKLYRDTDKPLTKQAERDVISDFARVLSTYDEYGDIFQCSFEEWWANRGLAMYGSPHNKPIVKKIAGISQGELYEPLFGRALEHYFNKQRAGEGNPPALLLAVPLGQPKRQLLAYISKLIDAEAVPLPSKSQRAIKPLVAKRLRSAPLFIMLRILMARAQYPEIPLWRIGKHAGVSQKYAQTEITLNKKRLQDADAKIHLSILTSRYLLKAKCVAEQAARGQFPSSSKLVLPTFDLDAIFKRLQARYSQLKAGKTTKSK